MIMFKPARILQVGVLSLFLTGCASTQTTAPSPLPISPKSTTQPNIQNTGEPSSVDSTSIKAGSSIARAEGFLLADGRLKPDIQAYANEVAERRGVPLPQVESLLRAAQYNATAAKLMAPAKTRIRRSWITYKNRFVEPVRIKTGQEFWIAHRTQLDRVAKEYGVPPSIVVAIIGVETIYGRHTGNFKVLDALATLGFRYPDSSRPERSQLFRDQLADLIQLDHENKLDALSVTGSFAGAMGLPQFMPGSLMRYAADGDRDGRIDLHGSPDDAIASVARFLRLHGWVPGLPVFAPATLPDNAGTLVKGGLYPTYDWSQLEAQGVREAPQAARGQAAAWKGHKLGVVDLIDEPRNLAEYRVGTPNFFAITHYNRSYFYAGSVADLAEVLAGKMGYGRPN
jgi:membrane-bound lytic murein transglycosylase B